MISAERTDGALQVAVQAELTIYQVAELHSAAIAWLAEPCAWQLDLSQVPEIDGAGLQWLLYLQRQLQSSGHGLTLVAASEAVQLTLQLCPGALPPCPLA